MGHNNAIRNDDGIIENQLWSVAKDENNNGRYVAGIKVLENNSEKRKYDLPIESNTSELYFKTNSNGEIIQLRVYDKETHKAIMDIDIGSGHGKDFPVGLAHVQPFKVVNGKRIRDSKHARLLTDEEIKKYGPLLKAAKKDVRFRRNE